MRPGWVWVLLAAVSVGSCTPYSPPVVSEESQARFGETGLVIEQVPQPGCGLSKFMAATTNFYFYIDDRLVGDSSFCEATRQLVPLAAGEHRLRIHRTELSPATFWTEVLKEENRATFNLDTGQTGLLYVSETTGSEWVGGQEEYATKSVFRLSGVNEMVWE